MKVDTQQLKTEIEPLAVAHGVELVALEWLQGPGRGVLRLYIDRPGGDPRTAAEERGSGATADVCARLSRDVSAVLDKLDEDAFPMPYDLEVSSPGFERPVQKREDFDRFKGLVALVKVRRAINGKGSIEGVLDGTRDAEKGFSVVLLIDSKPLEINAGNIARAYLAEIKAPKSAKPGKGPRKNRPPAEGAAASRTEDHNVGSDDDHSAVDRDER